MPAPESINEFAHFIALGELLPQEQIVAYLRSLQAAEALPAGPADLANRMVVDGLLTRFQAEQLMAGKYRGFTLGKYQLLERIGKGGMGSVFLAIHRGMNRRVALKVLSPESVAEDGVVDRFYREARAAAALDHPNIARAHDVDRHGDVHFLVMEFVDGIDLHDLVARRGPLAPAHAAHYIRQAAEGLAHAHERRLVHRDIKPSNLMVNRQGVVKLLDMGLARFFQDKSDNLTRDLSENSVFGTLDYIAPEQALDSHEVDIRADIYSLGATMFFLLVGRPPFAGGTTAQKLVAHQLRQPDDVHALRPEVPAGLAAVVARMLAKEPADRPQTPDAVAAALAEFAAAEPPPPLADMPKWSRAAAAGGGMIPPETLTFIQRQEAAPMTQRPRREMGPSTIAPRRRNPDPERNVRQKEEPDEEAPPPLRDPRRDRLKLVGAAAVCLLAVGALAASWLFTYGPFGPDAPKERILEGESLRVAKQSGPFYIGPQAMEMFKASKWGGNAQLWASPTKVGEWADLALPVPVDGKYQVIARLTRASDYGIVEFSLNGQPLGKPFDGFVADKVANSEPLPLGVVELKKGTALFQVKVVGTNPSSKGARFMWGLDAVTLKPA